MKIKKDYSGYTVDKKCHGKLGIKNSMYKYNTQVWIGISLRHMMDVQRRFTVDLMDGVSVRTKK